MKFIVFFLLVILLPAAFSSELAGKYDRVTLETSAGPMHVDFFFDKTGTPQGGIILTYDALSSHQVNNLAFVLSQFGWSVATTSLEVQTELPRRTIRPTASSELGSEPEDANTERGTEQSDSVDESNPDTPSDVTDAGAETTAKTSTLVVATEETNLESEPPETQEVGTTVEFATEEPSAMEQLRLKQLNTSARLDAVINFMEQEKGQLNLVFLSMSQTWSKLNQYIVQHQNRLKNVHGMILLDVQQPGHLDKLPPEMPILDILSKRHTIDSFSTNSFTTRKTNARRFKLKRYQQIQLHTNNRQLNFREDKLAKRIRGWLYVNVRGMEVDKGET